MHVWPYASIPSYTFMLFAWLSIGVHFYSVMFDEAYGHLYLYVLFVHYKPHIQPKLFSVHWKSVITRVYNGMKE
jgi:hypothetical protein